MSLLISSAALSLLAVLAVWLIGRRDPAQSPLLTLGSLLTLLALPVLALLPKLTVELPALPLSAQSGNPSSSLSLFLLLWMGGFLFFTLRMVADLISLYRWRSGSLDSEDPAITRIVEDCRQQLGLRPTVRVRFHPLGSSPCIAGLFRPVVYLPLQSRSWNDETMRMVLLHELGHVARRDLLTNLIAQCACLVYWFNPLVWWLRSQLMAQCEFACDARVISVGTDPNHYATALCDVAEASALPQAALAMAGRAPLRARVERVICRHRPGHSLLVGAALLLTVSASLGLSVVRLSPAQLSLAGTSGQGMEVPSELYTPEELALRSNANPFPAD